MAKSKPSTEPERPADTLRTYGWDEEVEGLKPGQEDWPIASWYFREGTSMRDQKSIDALAVILRNEFGPNAAFEVGIGELGSDGTAVIINPEYPDAFRRAENLERLRDAGVCHDELGYQYQMSEYVEAIWDDWCLIDRIDFLRDEEMHLGDALKTQSPEACFDQLARHADPYSNQ